MKKKSSPPSLREKFIFKSEYTALYKDLYSWRQNIGSPVLLDVAELLPAPVKEVTVVSWNVWIGRGNFDRLFFALKKRGIDPEDVTRPVIFLIQEAYRSDPFVPHEPKGKFYGGRLPRAQRQDIVEVARQYQLSLRYMPSMHNGASHSDRGNAILSNVALGTTWSLTLPQVKQNRVAVAAEILGLPDITFISAHIDVSGDDKNVPSRFYTIGAGRVQQAKALIQGLVEQSGRDTVIGADLNTSLGGRDPVVKLFAHEGFVTDPGLAHGHTFHGPLRRLRLALDHVFVRSQRIASVAVRRLDEVEDDKTRYIFGSDHHPLVATIKLK